MTILSPSFPVVLATVSVSLIKQDKVRGLVFGNTFAFLIYGPVEPSADPFPIFPYSNADSSSHFVTMREKPKVSQRCQPWHHSTTEWTPENTYHLCKKPNLYLFKLLGNFYLKLNPFLNGLWPSQKQGLNIYQIVISDDSFLCSNWTLSQCKSTLIYIITFDAQNTPAYV